MEDDWGAAAFGQRVVARYRDGRIVRGETRDFSPGQLRMRIFQDGTPGDPGTVVCLAELKALFFVKSLDGNRFHHEHYRFSKVIGVGERTVVMFSDREVIVGYTLARDPSRQGFFLVPAEPTGNNNRIYAINRAVRTLQYV